MLVSERHAKWEQDRTNKPSLSSPELSWKQRTPPLARPHGAALVMLEGSVAGRASRWAQNHGPRIAQLSGWFSQDHRENNEDQRRIPYTDSSGSVWPERLAGQTTTAKLLILVWSLLMPLHRISKPLERKPAIFSFYSLSSSCPLLLVLGAGLLRLCKPLWVGMTEVGGRQWSISNLQTDLCILKICLWNFRNSKMGMEPKCLVRHDNYS